MESDSNSRFVKAKEFDFKSRFIKPNEFIFNIIFSFSEYKYKKLTKFPIPSFFIRTITEPDLIFTSFLLNQCIELLFIYNIFPKDIIYYIIDFYWILSLKYILENININNICNCKKKSCMTKWYSVNHNIKTNWGINHCRMDRCHELIYFTDRSCNGFNCCECDLLYCSKCESKHENGYCFICAPKRDYIQLLNNHILMDLSLSMEISTEEEDEDSENE